MRWAPRRWPVRPATARSPACRPPPPAPNQNPGFAPNGPFSLTAIGGTDSVALSFHDNADNETGLVVERALVQGEPFATVVTLPPAPGTHSLVTFTETSLPAGIQFYYRVYAINGSYQSSFTNLVGVLKASAT